MSQLKTKPTYKIFVLDEDEFNGLHKYIPEVKKKDLEKGLGFANPRSKECYIKRTGVKEWDDETIIHEAEELLAKYSSHEDEQNIRWKSGSNFFNTGIGKAITTAVVGLATGGLGLPAMVGTGLGAGTGAIMGYQKGKGRGALGGALTGALSGYGGSLAGAGAAKGATAAAPGFFSKAGGALKGAAGGLLGKASATKPFTPSPSTMGTPSPVMGTSVPGYTPPYSMSAASPTLFPASTIGTAPGVSGAVGPTGGSAVPGWTPPALSNVLGSAGANVASKFVNPFAPKLPTTLVTPQVPVAGAEKVITGAPTFMEKAGEFIKSPTNVLGLASMGSSMLPKTPQFEMPSYVSDLRTKLMEGETLSSLGQQARSSLSEILDSEPTELYPTANDEYYEAALRRTRESYTEAGKRLDSAYNLAGVYGSGEHLAEKSKLQEELARTESALYAQTEQRRFEMARTEKYQAIQDSLGVDRDTMDDIVGLTGLDVQTAAMVYGAQVADITSIRESLGTLGMELMMRGKVKSDGGLSTLLGQ